MAQRRGRPDSRDPDPTVSAHPFDLRCGSEIGVVDRTSARGPSVDAELFAVGTVQPLARSPFQFDPYTRVEDLPNLYTEFTQGIQLVQQGIEIEIAHSIRHLPVAPGRRLRDANAAHAIRGATP